MADSERDRLIRKKTNLQRRTFIYDLIRTFFQERRFFKIETPIRVPAVAPEVEIVPFESDGWFLSTSPELYMKRLLAAGYDKLYQICRCFRKGEQGRWHNSEFTLLEWYRINADYLQMVSDTEQLMLVIAKGLEIGDTICYKNRRIDIKPPWPKISVREAFLVAAGWDPIADLDPARFDMDLVTKVIPNFAVDRPTVLIDYPAAMASLACLKPDDPTVSQRAEIFIGGLELANAYTELSDPQEQSGRFQKEIEQLTREQKYSAVMPLKFLQSMVNLPPCGGIALGVDRLVMLFCNADSVDEVIAFTADEA
jgi:lysyl-tRNA synthetase class 2